MDNFSFNTSYEERKIDNILKERNRKASKQQIIFILFFVIIIAALSIYLSRKALYTEFDGYLNTEYHEYRALQDIFVHKVYNDVGDIVAPGDTVLSYVVLSNFIGAEDVYTEPSIINQNREWRVQYYLARQDLSVLDVRVRELERQLSIQDHNISFGLSTNEKKMSIEKELAEAKEQLKVKRNQISTLLDAFEETNFAASRGRNGSHNHLSYEDIRNSELLSKLGLLRYSISANDAIVTKISVPNNIGVLKGESILYAQDLDLASNNLSISCLIPIDKMNRIDRNSRVEVIVNRDVSFTAHVSLIGTRTEEIPAHWRSTFNKNIIAIVAHLKIDEDQIVPFWALVKNNPVTIRVRNKNTKIGTTNKNKGYLYYDISSGEIVDSFE